MSIIFIKGDAPSYQALSTDIWSGCATPGITWIGADVYLTDTQEWKRVLPDLTLATMSQTLNIPIVTIAASGSFTGMHYISSSAVTVTGPNVSNRSGFLIEAHPDNAGNVYITGVGGTSGCGYYLDAAQQIVFSGSNLSSLIFGSLTSGCVCWMKI